MTDDDFGGDTQLNDAFETAQQNVERNTRRSDPDAPKVQQPKPQALPSRAGPTSILVSTRQKGNPILNSVKTVPWEYSDIPADYVLGATTCALFLSLKYHRLHPEYIYNRIQKLRGMYNLRILLTMVDIQNHEEPLKELSKTSLINNVTIILCWSAQEAGRYLELYKTYEHAAPTSIKAHQSTNYSDKLVDFITVPRSINKTDAIGLVSNFGSLRTAVNAQPEEVALIAGWGEKKVQRWCNSVREPFRVRKAAKRIYSTEQTRASLSREPSHRDGEGPPEAAAVGPTVLDGPFGSEDSQRPGKTHDIAEEVTSEHQEILQSKAESIGETSATVSNPAMTKTQEQDLSEGVMAALAKLRKS
ncbi:DNA repair protein rad10 [Pseudovirgaria hyperparasitica]|uniref:DNA repair protein rad10 n=1 Tax=Pseudovirgaria hyperparasitica TaxID=470096 RepID=A0A6A6WJL1_9PEZI|nr:DNA repair protein rad10 [Pseudovirgaria hyperparasitica]KAF2762007.1 DNA repair protein rad10 [Pseudovirgaria hyperparasitica]